MLIGTDYLVVGAGATGLAFADSLLLRTPSNLVFSAIPGRSGASDCDSLKRRTQKLEAEEAPYSCHPTYYSGHRKRAEPSGSKSSRSRSAVASRSADRSGSVDPPQSIVSHSQSRHSVRKARTSGEVGSS